MPATPEQIRAFEDYMRSIGIEPQLGEDGQFYFTREQIDDEISRRRRTREAESGRVMEQFWAEEAFVVEGSPPRFLCQSALWLARLIHAVEGHLTEAEIEQSIDLDVTRAAAKVYLSQVFERSGAAPEESLQEVERFIGGLERADQ
jgi:hypothetical protein